MLRPLSGHALVQIWELGLNRHPLDRALVILAVAFPERAWDELARLEIGRRDALLLDVREGLFGPQLNSFIVCPACRESLEFALDCAGIRGTHRPDNAQAAHQLDQDGYEVLFRAPDSLDLAAVAVCADVGAARDLLIERCVMEVRRDGQLLAACDLPDSLVATIGERLAAGDPQAEITLDLACPACDKRWQSQFDIAAFLWTEVSAAARRLLYDVDSLARVYGWSEADILDMSPARRHFYLEMVHG